MTTFENKLARPIYSPFFACLDPPPPQNSDLGRPISKTPTSEKLRFRQTLGSHISFELWTLRIFPSPHIFFELAKSMTTFENKLAGPFIAPKSPV